MTTISRALNDAPIVLPGLAAASLQRAFQAARQALRGQRTRRALNRLPDHALKDIGLRRCEIDSIAQALAEGRRDETRIVPRNVRFWI